MKGRLYWWGCVLAVIVAAAGASAWSGPEQPPSAEASRAARPIVIQKCTVILRDEVVLSFERAGILGTVSVREGDQVSEGQLLAKLKDDVAKAALAVAEKEASSDVDIRYAQAASGVAHLEHERMLEANRRTPTTIPEIDVRKAGLAAEKTDLEIEKATHTRDVNVLKRNEAAVQLDTYQMEAPFEGFITRVR